MTAKCGTCREIVNFGIDKLGRLYEICPVCHEGKKPTFDRKPERKGSRLCYYEGCANGFDPVTPSDRYCSPECQDAAKEETLAEIIENLAHQKCEYINCREWYKPLAMNQRFCSRLCRRKHIRLEVGKKYSRTVALQRAAQMERT